MKKTLIWFCVLNFTFVFNLKAQKEYNTDHIEEFSKIEHEEIRYLIQEGGRYYFFNPDTTIFLAKQAIELSKKKDYFLGEIIGLNFIGEMNRFLGDYPNSLDFNFKALDLSRRTGNRRREGISLGLIGITYLALKEYNTALEFLLQAKTIYHLLDAPPKASVAFNFSNISESHRGLGNLDSAFYYAQKALNNSYEIDHPFLRNICKRRLGAVQFELNLIPEAKETIKSSFELMVQVNDRLNYSATKNLLAEIYGKEGKIDSSIFYAKEALQNAINFHNEPESLLAALILGNAMLEIGKLDSAIYYKDLAFEYQNLVYGPETYRKVNLIALREQQRQQEAKEEQIRYEAKVRQTTLWTSVTVFFLISIFLYWLSRRKQIANRILELKNKKIQQTLSLLQFTQNQLIQKEKMAALGEITAGIAHEIQNPLNFVTNFAETGNELIVELKSEMEKPVKERDPSLEKEILNDLSQSFQKIEQHGKRADGIVKNMLLHSRSTTGEMELTDINALADEYLKLSYHSHFSGKKGLSSEENSYQAEIETDFDPNLPKIKVIPQEIGRVLLNLLNNSFYAVQQKQLKLEKDGLSDLSSYKPLVRLSTKLEESKVRISIWDNGSGIPKNLQSKIFQPFFTTKPTGEGTGLGLSLSFDIITKGHGGEINAESKEGEFTEFSIFLPIENISMES
jgi:two-component system, NtrC family, sensor kinase